MSINEQMDEQKVAHLCNGILFSQKSNEVLIHVTRWMILKSMLC